MRLKKRILVVDDISANVKVLGSLLKIKYDVSIATSGPDALNIVNASERIDLILLDIMMPDMDGYQVLRELKAQKKNRDIPVIFITALNRDEDESKGFAAGCVDYITKPFCPPTVLARVRTHLELHQAKQELEQQNAKLKEAAKLRESVEHITRHDLKNPLTVIMSGVDSLGYFGDLNEDQAEIVEDMKEGAKKMLDMINASLDLFKMEQKLYRLHPVDVDLTDILRRIERELQSLIRIKKSRFSLKADGREIDEKTVLLVSGEPLMIYSMLTNLMKNALEAIPEEGRIEVSLEQGDSFVDINIHNTGVVPESIRDSFFDKLVTYGKENGTGLGTYSAKLIAETMKGNISMKTSDEHGTDILVQIPAAGRLQPD